MRVKGLCVRKLHVNKLSVKELLAQELCVTKWASQAIPLRAGGRFGKNQDAS